MGSAFLISNLRRIKKRLDHAEHGGDEDQMIAAMLHDWLEDIPGAKADVLRARWGDRVADLVGSVEMGHRTPAPEPRNA